MKNIQVTRPSQHSTTNSHELIQIVAAYTGLGLMWVPLLKAEVDTSLLT